MSVLAVLTTNVESFVAQVDQLRQPIDGGRRAVGDALAQLQQTQQTDANRREITQRQEHLFRAERALDQALSSVARSSELGRNWLSLHGASGGAGGAGGSPAGAGGGAGGGQAGSGAGGLNDFSSVTDQASALGGQSSNASQIASQLAAAGHPGGGGSGTPDPLQASPQGGNPQPLPAVVKPSNRDYCVTSVSEVVGAVLGDVVATSALAWAAGTFASLALGPIGGEIAKAVVGEAVARGITFATDRTVEHLGGRNPSDFPSLLAAIRHALGDTSQQGWSAERWHTWAVANTVPIAATVFIAVTGPAFLPAAFITGGAAFVGWGLKTIHNDAPHPPLP